MNPGGGSATGERYADHEARSGTGVGGRPANASADLDTSAHRDAVRQLFQDHNRALIKFLMTRLPSEQEAVEVAQEAYVRLLQLHKPEAVGFLRGYLFKIAANLSVDRLRQRSVRERLPPTLFEELSAPNLVEEHAISRQEFDLAWRALQEVPEAVRRAFVLRFVEGYYTGEVARVMQVDERTVRKYITRALMHCRGRMLNEDGEREW